MQANSEDDHFDDTWVWQPMAYKGGGYGWQQSQPGVANPGPKPAGRWSFQLASCGQFGSSNRVRACFTRSFVSALRGQACLCGGWVWVGVFVFSDAVTREYARACVGGGGRWQSTRVCHRWHAHWTQTKIPTEPKLLPCVCHERPRCAVGGGTLMSTGSIGYRVCIDDTWVFNATVFPSIW